MERIEEGNAGAKAEAKAEVVKAVEAAVESWGAVGTCLALCFRSSRFSSLVKKSNIGCTVCLYCFSKACFASEQFICIGEHFQVKRLLVKH